MLGRNRRYVLTDYVTPLLEEGLLVRTHPENLRHPAQKYRTPAEPDVGEEE